ncbi:ABC transporter ATP-binding protein [Bacillus spongiae]|uniref:ABC transporter ATP-binding protein n=1 Tax=Bacillus spongiae TaxID=2683610 RepID=A0ABU8HH33_9BACI
MFNNRNKKEQQNGWRTTIWKIWGYMRVYRVRFMITLFTVILSSILALMAPYFLGVAVDELIVKADVEKTLYFIGLLVIIYVLQMITLVLQNNWMIDISQKTVFQMRNDLFFHLQNLPLAFFQERQQGELMSRMTNDIENVSRTLNSAVLQIATSSLMIVGTIGMMLWLSPLMTLVTLMIVPFLFFGLRWITKRTGRYFKEQQKHLGELNGFVEESLSGQQLIKMYSKEEEMKATFQERNEEYRQAGFWAQTYTGFIPKLMNMLNNVSFAAIVGVGGILAINGYVTIGVIVTFTAYARQFTRPLNDLANQLNMVLSAVAGAERVFAIMEEPIENRDEEHAKKYATLQGNVKFENVTFSYEGDQSTLKNISFEVNEGDTIALVGPTGAGKSTILNILARFYEPEHGQVWVDDIALTKIKRASLREHLGLVLQDSFLFETTIMENIRYGNLGATDEEVIIAAKRANAHEFIMAFQDGYHTILSEKTTISFGQRQLIAIARAFLKEPSLLLLDEATSSIDTITELKINDALSTLMNNRTTFVIAHRLNTILNADNILVLNNGEIIEQGKHEELLERNGFYAKLYYQQRLTETG